MGDRPHLHMFVGPMFSEKTTKLICSLRRDARRGYPVSAFKARLDTRYDSDFITTHDKIKFPATVVSNGRQLDDAISNSDCQVFGVDELFLIDGASEVILKHFINGKSFYISSIQISASGNVFDEVQALLPYATGIDLCKAVCSKCGEDALYTEKKVSDLDEIAVGGAELYSPACFKHFSGWDV